MDCIIYVFSSCLSALSGMHHIWSKRISIVIKITYADVWNWRESSHSPICTEYLFVKCEARKFLIGALHVGNTTYLFQVFIAAISFHSTVWYSNANFPSASAVYSSR